MLECFEYEVFYVVIVGFYKFVMEFKNSEISVWKY